MICLGTTILVHLWRHRSDESHPVHRVLREYPSEVFGVPVSAPGELLEGAAFVSEQRLTDGVRLLGMFLLGETSLETARQYAVTAAELRRKDQLAGMSRADLWIAAWALQHAARLSTASVKHYERIPGLELLPY